MKKFSLKNRLMLTFVILNIFSIGTMMLITQREYYQQMIQELYHAELESLKTKSLIFDEAVRNYEALTIKIFADRDIRGILQLDETRAESEYAVNLSLLKDKLRNMDYSADITSVILASPTKIYVSSYDMGGNIVFYENEFYQELKKQNGKMVIFHTDSYLHLNNPNIKTFAIGRLIIGDNMQEIGYEMVFISDNFFKSMTFNQDINMESSYYIASQNEKIMYSRINSDRMPEEDIVIEKIRENESQFFVETVENEKLLFCQYKSDYTGWIQIGIIELDIITVEIISTIIKTVVLAAIILIISILLIQLIIRSIIRPLTDMQNIMIEISNGNMLLRLPKYKPVELDSLAFYFNQMLDKINLLIEENNKKKALMRDMEFQMLQAQINPHFLYNTLDSIRWLAIFSNQTQIKHQIECLSSLLRATLSDMRSEVPLEQEIMTLTYYSEIMRIRYYNFTLNVNLSEESKKGLVPKFILQPLIENAILHGLIDSDREGVILVESQISEGQLNIQIKDNGVGMSEEKVEMCMHQQEGGFNHIGIFNVSQRLRLIYGEQCDFSLMSELNQGTQISICIPMKILEET